MPNIGEGLNKRKYNGSRSRGGIKDGAGDPTSVKLIYGVDL